MNIVKTKIYLGRKVKEEKVFAGNPRMVFGALYEATEWLNKQGYSESTFYRGEPMGFTLGSYRSYEIPWNWRNLTEADKKKLSGVMVSSDWREGDVKVIFFED